MGRGARTMRSTASTLVAASALLLATTSSLVHAHPHHHHGPADESVPIDSILWIHIAVQAFVWLALFPLTMVLGLVRHRLHVPLSALSLLLTTGGYIMGHKHGGRSFPHTAHGTAASMLIYYLGAQAVLGVYLKLHLRWPGERIVRPPLLFLHGVLGRLFPLVGWVQCLFGILTLRSWCFGAKVEQCLTHHVAGSALLAYAVILLIFLKAGAAWLHRRGQSQQWLDSLVMLLWGCLSLGSELLGGAWAHHDRKHLYICGAWVVGGAAGLWLSRGGRHSVVPGAMIIFTGWALSSESHPSVMSTTVASIFGYVLIAAGVARVLETFFVQGEGLMAYVPCLSRPAGSSEARPQRQDIADKAAKVTVFQYVPPYLLIVGGVLYMSATDEEVHWAESQGLGALSWTLIDFGIALVFFVWANTLVGLYTMWGGYRGQAGATQTSTSLEHGQRPPATRTGTGPSYVALSRRSESAGVRASLLGGAADETEKTTTAPRRAASGLSSSGDAEKDGQHVLFADSDEDDDPFDDERDEDVEDGR